MPKRQPSEHKGGRLPGGTHGAKSKDPKINPGWGVKTSLKEAIAALPQVASGEWSESYLVEQVLLNFLQKPADYDWSDLQIAASGRIVE